MIQEIKKMLLNNPQNIKTILEYYDYHHIDIKENYIQFGRAENTNKKAIVIYLKDNDFLNVKDFSRNICCDLFSYIIKQRKVDFSDVLQTLKSVFNITDWYYKKRTSIFDGFYDGIKKNRQIAIKTYDSSILDNYVKCGCTRFLKDNISLKAQKYFNICYDVESQGIVIPIYDIYGEIMGIKVRCNWEVKGEESKYFYLVSCQLSQTLYGFSQNYQFLTGGIVFVFESEKSVMQCYAYGFRNCVAIGSSSISSVQCKLLLSLNPKSIVFMFDEGLDFEIIQMNINKFKVYAKMLEVNLEYWDSTTDSNIPSKSSPSDLGKDKFIEIINKQTKVVRF